MAISSLLFQKSTFIFNLVYSATGEKKEFTQVGSASEQPGTEHTQIYPDFIYEDIYQCHQSWLTISFSAGFAE